MSEITNPLASQIKSARHRLNLSQSQAAKAWKLPLKTLQQWEQGRAAPRSQTLLRLMPIWFPSLVVTKPPKRKGRRPPPPDNLVDVDI